MRKILVIGNSFSEDATYYLHQTAKAAGIETKVVNLYIGGCSLERHWSNVESAEAAYQYQINGKITERYVSIQEMLREDTWDDIVTQQVSHDSGWGDSYEPFLGLLVDYLRRQVPKAQIWLHKTWAYDTNSTHEHFMRYHRNQMEMYERLSKCYERMAEKYHLPLIPSADVIQKLRSKEPFLMEAGGRSLCRDGFHMDFLYGRYALACVWVRALFGVPVKQNTYIPHTDLLPEEQADEKVLSVIRMTVDEYFA